MIMSAILKVSKMTKVYKPMFSDVAYGVFARLLSFRRSPSVASVAGLPKRKGIVTSAMQNQRDLYSYYCSIWNSLSPATKLIFENNAPNTFTGFNCFLQIYLASGWPVDWLAGYSKRVRIVVDHTKIDSSLTHFPLVINLSAASGSWSMPMTEIFTDLQNNYLKLAVTKNDGLSQLYVEIAPTEWDFANNKGLLYVSKSDFIISSLAGTVLYLYWDSAIADNSDYVAVCGSRHEVWNANIKAFLGCSQDPSGGAPQILDSTSNHHHGTSVGTMLSADLVNGKIGKALDFDGSNDGIYTAAAPITAYPFTLQAIGKFVVIDNYPNLVCLCKSSVNTGYVFISCQTTFGRGGVVNVSTAQITGSDVYALNDYILLSLVCTSATDRKLYINGVLAGSDVTNLALPATLNNLSIGYTKRSSPIYQAGIIGKVSVFNIALSSAWVKAFYYSFFDNLNVFGYVENAV